MRSLLPFRLETSHHEFHSLMPYRVREVLLVSSAYDAFALEDDGTLTEQLFTRYTELNLESAPRITRVSTAKDALNLLKRRPFQLVITLARVEDTDAGTLSRRIKEHHPHMPVALLSFDEASLDQFPGGRPPASIDYTFIWPGDARILIAAIKLVEDRLNVTHDIEAAGVQVIVIVEDRIRTYSTFLSFLYPELLLQSQSLIEEGLNDQHRRMRMRARPKLVLATSYERAQDCLNRWGNNIMALMSDIRFPKGDEEDAEAGLLLAKSVRRRGADYPILLLSTEPNIESRADELDAWFVHKKAPDFHAKVRTFLKRALGFGPFIFLMPDGKQVDRADNVFEMETALKRVPLSSISHHAKQHDFSVWLRARCMFVLAAQIRPLTEAEFGGPEEMRDYLVGLLEKARSDEQEGLITDFSSRQPDAESRFLRLGKGSIGGKGRSIAFVASLLAREGLTEKFPGFEIRIPMTLVLGTDEFDAFIAQVEGPDNPCPNDDVRRLRLLNGRFSLEAIRDLRSAFDGLRGPIAVRSSSLLEDSRYLPFAGIYETYMLPNNHPDPDTRFAELRDAIRRVYASTFSRDARSYTAGTPHSLGEEKMAVVIQEVVGQPHGDRYYPHIAGVAQSYNYYPFGHQRPDDGVAIIVLGLGHMVVTGGAGLRFSPGAPEVLPQFPDAQSMVRHSQTQFFALDLSKMGADLDAGVHGSLSVNDLKAAEDDGTLALSGSVYSPADDIIRDNLKLSGPRVLTFNNVLKWASIPLSEALGELLRSLRAGTGGEVEIEFAVDMGDHGKSVRRGKKRRPPGLYVLQARPMVRPEHEGLIEDLDALPPERILCETKRALGHGRISDIRDVVYIADNNPDSNLTRAMAAAVAEINDKLMATQRPYLLIGPGRWGTSDPSLGIPVEWPQIAAAKVIVETPLGEHHIEPSQGTHFFHNLTSLRIGYLTVGPETQGRLDMGWLDGLPAQYEKSSVRHVELPVPLTVYMDGRHGRAAILKPEAPDDGQL